MIDLLRMRTSPENEDNYEEVAPLVTRNRREEFETKLQRVGLLVFYYMIPVVLIFVGVLYIPDCPDEERIPISLIVIGGLILLSRLLNSPFEFRYAFSSRESTQSVGQRKPLFVIVLNIILQVAIICCFLSACVWVYSTHPAITPPGHKLPVNCNVYFLNGMFWAATIGLIFLGLTLILGCGFACYSACK